MSASLFLAENEVPVGAKVHIYEHDSNLPFEVEGKPVVLQRLIGGVSPMGARFYRDVAPGRGEGWGSNFAEDIRFSPLEVYSLQDAPADKRYAVFYDNKRMIHGQKEWEKHPYELVKSGGRILVACGFPFYPCSYVMTEDVARQYGDSKISDGYLIERLGEVRREWSSVEELPDHIRGGFDSDVFHREVQRKEQRLLEALAGRHRQSIPELVQLFERVGKEYLVNFPMPADAQLVPIK